MACTSGSSGVRGFGGPVAGNAGPQHRILDAGHGALSSVTDPRRPLSTNEPSRSAVSASLVAGAFGAPPGAAE
jgi:hypothetical protein